MRCLHYRRYETNVSDHKPVSGGFEVTIKSVRAADRAAVKQQVEKEYGARQVSLLQDALRFYKKSL